MNVEPGRRTAAAPRYCEGDPPAFRRRQRAGQEAPAAAGGEVGSTPALPHLPEPVVGLVLSHLGWRELLRARCVSRTFCAAADTPEVRRLVRLRTYLPPAFVRDATPRRAAHALRQDHVDAALTAGRYRLPDVPGCDYENAQLSADGGFLFVQDNSSTEDFELISLRSQPNRTEFLRRYTPAEAKYPAYQKARERGAYADPRDQQGPPHAVMSPDGSWLLVAGGAVTDMPYRVPDGTSPYWSRDTHPRPLDCLAVSLRDLRTQQATCTVLGEWPRIHWTPHLWFSPDSAYVMLSHTAPLPRGVAANAMWQLRPGRGAARPVALPATAAALPRVDHFAAATTRSGALRVALSNGHGRQLCLFEVQGTRASPRAHACLTQRIGALQLFDAGRTLAMWLQPRTLAVYTWRASGVTAAHTATLAPPHGPKSRLVGYEPVRRRLLLSPAEDYKSLQILELGRGVPQQVQPLGELVAMHCAGQRHPQPYHGWMVSAWPQPDGWELLLWDLRRRQGVKPVALGLTSSATPWVDFCPWRPLLLLQLGPTTMRLVDLCRPHVLGQDFSPPGITGPLLAACFLPRPPWILSHHLAGSPRDASTPASDAAASPTPPSGTECRNGTCLWDVQRGLAAPVHSLPFDAERTWAKTNVDISCDGSTLHVISEFDVAKVCTFDTDTPGGT